MTLTRTGDLPAAVGRAAADVVEAVDVHKSYGERVALRGVNLSLRAGEILALVGPNGAGKSTLVRIIAALVRADCGQVRVCGHSVDAAPQAVRRMIGLLPQDALPDPQANAWEHVYYYLWARLGARRAARTAAEAALRAVDLWDRRRERTAKLSGGLQRRILLAMVVGAEPPLMLLDEPASALDPNARHELWNRLAEVRRRGAILLTTHDMAEAETVGDRVALVAGGRLVACDTPERLLARLPTTEKVALEEQPAGVALERYGTVRHVAGRPVLYPADDHAARAVTEALVTARAPFAVRRTTLEDTYLHLMDG